MENEINVIQKFSSLDEEVKIIENALEAITEYSMYHNSKYSKMADKSFSLRDREIENYSEKNQKTKEALLAFCADKAGLDKIGMKEIKNKADLARAFSNTSFREIFNSIIVETLQSVVLKARPEQICRLANVDAVGIGDSRTCEIEPKGLPIAQRTSYMTHVTFLNSYAKSSITVKPQPYSIGATLDYIRILANDYDIGRELARVAFAMLYAQLRLIVEEIYSIGLVQGTPFYQANWNATKYMQMIEDLKMVNGGADVTAYGTAVAFNAIGTLATTNYGFQSQDEMLREGFLGRAYGVDNVVLDQFTDLSMPFTDANADALRTIPNDKILLISTLGDKPVKLVREDFVRVKIKEPNEGTQYRMNYEYFMSFDAAIITQANYGIQSTTKG